MAGITRRNCEAQCDRIFHGRRRASSAWQLQSWYERWWQFVCAWGRVCVCVCICQAKKKKKRGKSSWKKNIPINKDSAQNNKVSPCSKALWLPLYLPLFPVSPPLPLPSPHLFFDHCPFFLQASLLLWLCTFCVCVCVCECFLLSFFPSLPWYHLDFDLHHRLVQPFSPFLVPPLLFPCLPLPGIFWAYTFVPLGLFHCLLPYVSRYQHIAHLL